MLILLLIMPAVVQAQFTCLTKVGRVTNVSVVVETCTEPASAVWTPLNTNSLASNGWFYFKDPDWKNYPSRLYRVRSR